MNKKMRLTLLFLCAGALWVAPFFACGDDEKITEDKAIELCKQAGDVYCGKIFECKDENENCAAAAAFFATEDGCKTFLESSCEAEGDGEGTAEGTAEDNEPEFTEAEARACLDAIEEQSCGDFCGGSCPDTCKPVFGEDCGSGS